MGVNKSLLADGLLFSWGGQGKDRPGNGALVGLRGEFQPTPMLFHDPCGNGKAEAAAAAIAFGGEKRVQDAFEIFGGDPAALVCYFHKNRAGLWLLAGGDRQVLVGGGEGLVGVLQQIDDDLLGPLEIAPHRRQPLSPQTPPRLR